MKKEIHADLKNIVVKSVSIDLDPDRIREGNVTLSVQGKSELRMPKAENDQSILLVSSIEISSQEQEDIFHAAFEGNFFFELSEKLSDYDDIVTKQCLPVIRAETEKLANKFMRDMGFSEIFGTGEPS